MVHTVYIDIAISEPASSHMAWYLATYHGPTLNQRITHNILNNSIDCHNFKAATVFIIIPPAVHPGWHCETTSLFA
jgi:hypothetical protein